MQQLQPQFVLYQHDNAQPSLEYLMIVNLATSLEYKTKGTHDLNKILKSSDLHILPPIVKVKDTS